MAYALLAALVLMRYLPTLAYAFTDLDDRSLIAGNAAFNAQFSNIWTAFGRGVFQSLHSPYYRPLFLDSVILDYQFFGDSPVGYHVVNVALHLAGVLLLYRLFTVSKCGCLASFVLAACFAIHPALTQAVAWIPGRNDSLLGIFVFAMLIMAVQYRNSGGGAHLIGAVVWGGCAGFTKETGLVALPVAAIWVLIYADGRAGRLSVLIGALSLCPLIWWLAVHFGTGRPGIPVNKSVVYAAAMQLPALVQYYGKCIIPIGLSPYPTLNDGALWPGLAAIAMTSALLFRVGASVRKRLVAGLCMFGLLLLPTLLVPNSSRSAPLFEHRLYVPIALLLPSLGGLVTAIRLPRRVAVAIAAVVCLLYMGWGWNYSRVFSGRVAFWSAAYAAAPHAATTNMMLAEQTVDHARKGALLRTALQLDSKHRYVNLRYGVFLLTQNSLDSAAIYLYREQSITHAVECEYYLAQTALYGGDTIGAKKHLRNFVNVAEKGAPCRLKDTDRKCGIVMQLSPSDWGPKFFFSQAHL